MGRPKAEKGPKSQAGTRLEAEMLARLDLVARQVRRNRSDTMRLLLEFALYAFDRLKVDAIAMPQALDGLLSRGRTSSDREKGRSSL